MYFKLFKPQDRWKRFVVHRRGLIQSFLNMIKSENSYGIREWGGRRGWKCSLPTGGSGMGRCFTKRCRLIAAARLRRRKKRCQESGWVLRHILRACSMMPGNSRIHSETICSVRFVTRMRPAGLSTIPLPACGFCWSDTMSPRTGRTWGPLRRNCWLMRWAHTMGCLTVWTSAGRAASGTVWTSRTSPLRRQWEIFWHSARKSRNWTACSARRCGN